jgi:hypothetical protein
MQDGFGFHLRGNDSTGLLEDAADEPAPCTRGASSASGNCAASFHRIVLRLANAGRSGTSGLNRSLNSGGTFLRAISFLSTRVNAASNANFCRPDFSPHCLQNARRSGRSDISRGTSGLSTAAPATSRLPQPAAIRRKNWPGLRQSRPASRRNGQGCRATNGPHVGFRRSDRRIADPAPADKTLCRVRSQALLRPLERLGCVT